jgi:hypothetical protein
MPLGFADQKMVDRRSFTDIMTGIFKIVEHRNRKQEKKDIGIGIDLRIGDQEILCRVTKTCESYEELTVEVNAIQNDLELILKKAKGFFGSTLLEEALEVTSEMSPEEIWSILSQIDSENLFTEHFNGLDETKRKELAEYVLTKCNIFTGKGSFFSRCYNSSSGFID